MKVEGILSSRFLYSLSPDPNDLQLLGTHFLARKSVLAIPDTTWKLQNCQDFNSFSKLVLTWHLHINDYVQESSNFTLVKIM